MDSRFVALAFVAVLVASLFAPVPVTDAEGPAEDATLAAGNGADGLLALDRLRPTVASSGMARADTEGVLEQSTRAAVYATVRDTPGTTLAGIAAAVDVTRSTVRYHVDVLREAGLIDATEVAGALRFAPAESDVELAATLNADGPGAVLAAVAEHEPASVTTLAEVTDRAPSTVSHHLSTLEDRGLVDRERAGEAVVTTLAPATRTAMTGDRAAPADD